MKIIRNFSDILIQDQNTSLAIGNFDGMHLGHQKVISSLKQEGGKIAIMSFEPHPVEFFAPDKPFFRLDDLGVKLLKFSQQNIDILFMPRFSAEFANISPHDFISILVNNLKIKKLVVGSDFRFGKARTGNVEMLINATINVEVIPQIDYSSSLIRKALVKGDLEEAKTLLGEYYYIYGRVIKGNQLGRKLGFKTANIGMKNRIRPKFGVYQGIAVIDGKRYNSAINIGKRPTLEGDSREFLEAHILGFDQDIYGKKIKIELVKFIREEKKFENLDFLKEQIKKDIDLINGLNII